MQQRLILLILVILLINLAARPAAGNESVWRSIGLRGGVYDGRNDEDFKQYEVFTTWQLPWSWQSKSGWSLNTYLEANAGLLRGGGESAFVGSIGPGIYFTGFKEKIDIVMGISPTIISKHKFGDENLGAPLSLPPTLDLILILPLTRTKIFNDADDRRPGDRFELSQAGVQFFRKVQIAYDIACEIDIRQAVRPE